MAKSNRREFLQLADTFKPAKHGLAGMYLSEKLDGTRCLWDGGVSRGKPTDTIPWANLTDPKTGLRKKKIKPVASGLWSRYGNPIMAPEEFLNKLPPFPLDGELWAGRGNFQICRSICAGDKPDARFNKQIEYAVYSSPSVDALFVAGEIKNNNFHKAIDHEACVKFWIENCLDLNWAGVTPGSTFAEELAYLQAALETQSNVYLHKQILLEGSEARAQGLLVGFLDGILIQGGEGVILRDPNSVWKPKRHRGIIKHKPFEDSEGKVIGYVAGKEGKQGNVLGKIGAVIVKWEDKTFEIGSGFTFDEREFELDAYRAWAAAHPGEDCPLYIDGKVVKCGDIITFKYRELTDDGIPKEARYWRKHKAL